MQINLKLKFEQFQQAQITNYTIKQTMRKVMHMNTEE